MVGVGYCKIAALLRQAGWTVSDGRVERIWRREGLKVPYKQPKRGRLWLTDGSCSRRVNYALTTTKRNDLIL
jgi:putative transposase